MTDHERLIQRFMDNELSAADQIRFLKAVDTDETFRREVRNSERLLRATGELPRLNVRPEFAAAVRHRIEAGAPSIWTRLRRTLMMPALVPLRVAQTLAMCLLIIGAWQIGRWSGSEQAVGDISGAPVIVRLVLVQPQARTVSIAGDFNGWQPNATPLERGEAGMWSVTLPLKPGRYHYMFVVDGRDWITDPFATDVSLDGFGAENAVLEVL